jgi:hypothetical protein
MGIEPATLRLVATLPRALYESKAACVLHRLHESTISFSESVPPDVIHRSESFYAGDVTEEESIFHFVRPRASDRPLLSAHLHGNRRRVDSAIKTNSYNGLVY